MTSDVQSRVGKVYGELWHVRILLLNMHLLDSNIRFGRPTKYQGQQTSSALYLWNAISQRWQSTLSFSYEYLRLYTNAYAFQATVTRAVAAKNQGHLREWRSCSLFYNSLPHFLFTQPRIGICWLTTFRHEWVSSQRGTFASRCSLYIRISRCREIPSEHH
jgi:hypothetical protein